MANESDRTIDLLEVSMTVVEAALDYEAILLKPREEVTEKAFKAVLNRLFMQAHRVMDMRLKNLQDALNCDDEGYQDFLRRN